MRQSETSRHIFEFLKWLFCHFSCYFRWITLKQHSVLNFENSQPTFVAECLKQSGCVDMFPHLDFVIRSREEKFHGAVRVVCSVAQLLSWWARIIIITIICLIITITCCRHQQAIITTSLLTSVKISIVLFISKVLIIPPVQTSASTPRIFLCPLYTNLSGLISNISLRWNVRH